MDGPEVIRVSAGKIQTDHVTSGAQPGKGSTIVFRAQKMAFPSISV